MAVLLAEYKVKDLNAFGRVVAEPADGRKEFGATGHRLMSSPDDPAMVALVVEFASLAEARAFSLEPRRVEALSRASVIERAHLVSEGDRGRHLLRRHRSKVAAA